MKFILIVVCCCYITISDAQNISYAKNVIDTLCSDRLAGRSYAFNGELKAAKFIAKEFKKTKLTPINSSFFQHFNFPLNTFNKDLSIKLDNKKLIPAEDYLVAPYSGQLFGSFKLVWYTALNIPEKKHFKKLVKRGFFNTKFIVLTVDALEKKSEVVDLIKLNAFGAAGIILLTNNKLNHSLSKTFKEFPVLIIKEDVISRKNKTINIELDQQYIRNYTSQNVIAKIEGKNNPDSIIVVCAHYDHLGMLGENVYFPGANDNASGVAMMLDLANYYSNNKPKKSIVFIAFGAEEAGLVGSKYFVNHPTINLADINFVINLDLMGTGDDGATIVNGSLYTKEFNLIDSLNQYHELLPGVYERGEAKNSDHYWFTQNGVPAFFIYTMGDFKAYHDLNDSAKNLPLNKYSESFMLIRLFIDNL